MRCGLLWQRSLVRPPTCAVEGTRAHRNAQISGWTAQGRCRECHAPREREKGSTRMRLRVAASTAFATGWADGRDAWLTHARRPLRARHDVDLHLRRGELSANQGAEHGMYYGDTASTAKTRNFANFSPVALACSYSGECRQRRRCSRLSQRVITTRPFGGSPSIAVPLPAAM